MNCEIIKEIESSQLKNDIPDFKVGDTVRVYAKIVEGTKERIQMFEGIVLKRQGGSSRETFTVRRIDHIEVVRYGIVRRAKLNYLRDRVGKAAKVKEDITRRSK